MKGAEPHIVAPEEAAWLFEGGGVGLATWGSGDVLAGLTAKLPARGAELTQAKLWGLLLHGEAGRIRGEWIGPLGSLARELSIDVPALLRDLAPAQDR